MKEKVLKTAKTIFFLSPVPTIVIAVPSFVMVIMALTGQISSPLLKYIAYALSAYALTISVTGMIRMIGFIRNDIGRHPLVKTLMDMPMVEKFVNENTFRTEMALYPGFCINVLYVIFKTSMGIYYRSAWFLSLGVYYLALAIMRFMLIHYMQFKRRNADKNDELRRYRTCGCMLFLIHVALVGITILAVTRNDGFTYPGYLIYVMAMYTFYSVITAIINLIKYHKYGSPVLSAAKVINTSTALVSVFSLETAMLAEFGVENEENFRVIMTALTGAGVSFIVIGMAVFMIVRATTELKNEAENING